MNKLNDLFMPKGSLSPAKSDWDQWSLKIVKLQKNWKGFHAYFVDLAGFFDCYGKQLIRSSTNFKVFVQKVGTRHSENLINALQSFTESYQTIGEVYSASSQQLMSTLHTRNTDLNDELTVVKKSIHEDVGTFTKELVTSKNRYERQKKSYETACKGAENIFSNLSKSKSINSFKIDVLQKHEEKAMQSKNEVLEMQQTLQGNIDDLNTKQEYLDSAVNQSTLLTQTLEIKIRETMLSIYFDLVQCFREQVGTRKAQTNIKQSKMMELANITLDIARQDSSRLERQLERKIESCDERQKLLAQFKIYLNDIVQSEDGFSKALGKIREYEALEKLESVQELIRQYVGCLNKLHLKISNATTVNALNQTKEMIAQLDMSKLTQLQTENLSKGGKTLELAIHSALADASNREAMRLQSIKKIMTSMVALEEEVHKSMESELTGLKDRLDQAEQKNSALWVEVVDKVTMPKLELKQNSALSELFTSVDLTTNRFGLNENIIDDYSWAFRNKILLQGRLYITHGHICFFSPFNSTTIFGKDPTQIVIPLGEIQKVQKAKNALIFDNAISIQTANEEFFFASFISRDQAYQKISQLLATVSQTSQKPQVEEIDFRLIKNALGSTMRKIVRPPSLDDQLVPHSIIKFVMWEHEFQELPVKVLCDLISSSSFMTRYWDARKDWEVNIGEWDPVWPEEIPNGFSQVPMRKVNYMHPLVAKLPMMPKKWFVDETYKMLWLSPKEFAVQLRAECTGFPYSDWFCPCVQYRAVEEENVTKFTVRYGCEFIKSTFLAGKIEKSGAAETKITTNEVYLPLVLSTIESYKTGKPAEDIVPKPEAQQEEPPETPTNYIQYVLLILVIILLVWCYRLSSRISELEARLDI